MGIHPRLPGLISDREPGDELVGTPIGSETPGPSRRGFLARIAAGGAALTVGSQLLPLGTLIGAQEGEEDAVEREGDDAIVAFLASVALAGSTAYSAAISSQNALVSEPVVEILRQFGAHHRRQAAGLNSLIEVPVEEPNATLLAEQEQVIEQAADQAALLTALQELEQAVAATHLAALGELEAQADAALVARALPVCAQQATVLGSFLDQPLEELVPESQTTDGALTEADYPLDAEAAPAEDGSTTTTSDGSTTTEGAEPEGDDSTTTTTES